MIMKLIFKFDNLYIHLSSAQSNLDSIHRHSMSHKRNSYLLFKKMLLLVNSFDPNLSTRDKLISSYEKNIILDDPFYSFSLIYQLFLLFVSSDNLNWVGNVANTCTYIDFLLVAKLFVFKQNQMAETLCWILFLTFTCWLLNENIA